MRARVLVPALVLIVVAVSFAGCIDAGDERTGGANASGIEEGSAGDQPGDARGGNGTAGDEANASEDGGDGPDGNRSGEASGESNATGEDGEGNGTVDPGWPPREQARIRPGADIVAHPEFDNACTANFVFASPDNRTLYVGTAAHCLDGRPIGDPVMVGGIADAGTIAYCSWGTIDRGEGLAGCPPSETLYTNASRYNDFALVAIDEAHRGDVHPATLHWGGPRGVLEGAEPGDRVATFGNTPVRDEGGGVLDPREGYVTCTLTQPSPEAPCRSTNTTWIRLVGHTFGGDSGSPVLGPQGQALGALTATSPTGDVMVANLEAALSLLHERTNLTVELTTAPPLAEPILPPGEDRPRAAR